MESLVINISIMLLSSLNFMNPRIFINYIYNNFFFFLSYVVRIIYETRNINFRILRMVKYVRRIKRSQFSIIDDSLMYWVKFIIIECDYIIKLNLFIIIFLFYYFYLLIFFFFWLFF